VVVALRRIIRAIDLHSRALAQKYGLTGPQLVVLGELARNDPCPIGDLSKRVHLSQATVTGILDRLEKRSLVERVRSTDDKRKVLVSATSDGAAILESAPPLLQEDFIEGFGRLPEWEQSQILSSLQRVVALMEARDFGATPYLATGTVDAEPESEETEDFLRSWGTDEAAD
jgi:DNA-binding MarR family transcriptional regulator